MDNKIRILGLINKGKINNAKIREDLMSEDFPAIWMKIERKKRNKT